MQNEEVRRSSLSTSNTEHTSADTAITARKLPVRGYYPRHFITAALTSKNKIFAFGNNSILNLQTMKWSKKPRADIDVPQGAVSCRIKDGLVIIFGGWSSGEYSDKLYYYFHGFCGEVLQPKLHPSGRKDHTLVYDQITDSVYLFGGWNALQWGNNINDDKMYRSLWSLQSDWIWKRHDTLGFMPCSRRGHSACISDYPYHCLVIYGGVYGYNKMLNSLYILNLAKMVWDKPTMAGIAPSERAWHSANVIGENMIVAGGLLQDGSSSNEVFCLNLSHMCWCSVKISGGIAINRYARDL